jgi:diketogulonate reductase-like aldo/keto reductase
MHWPVKESRLQSWDEMIKLQDEGLVRSIGVSNFMTWHLEELLNNSDIVPTVNQIEYNPYLYKKDVLDMCREKGILLEAYSPLTKARKLDDPPLIKIANKYNKTPAQILIRWVLQQEVVVIPKSTNQQRIHENIDVYDFEISIEDMQTLNALDENLVTGWNPQNQE